jgi:hypothetical protein
LPIEQRLESFISILEFHVNVEKNNYPLKMQMNTKLRRGNLKKGG